MKNKVVVIVGGSKGIGKGLYDAFIDKDCIVHSISRKNCDITSPDQVDSYFDKLDKVDILFLHLNDNEAFKKIIPSKIFELSCFNKPILAGVSGYAAEFIRSEIPDTIVFEPCDGRDMLDKILTINYVVKTRSEFLEKYQREKLDKQLAESIISYL